MITDLTALAVTAKGTATFVSKTILPPMVPVMAVAENVITESTGVPLTIVVAVGGACWYLQGRFTKIEDKIDAVADDLAKRPCQYDKCPTNQEKDKNK